MQRKTDLDKDIEKILVSAEEIEALTEKSQIRLTTTTADPARGCCCWVS